MAVRRNPWRTRLRLAPGVAVWLVAAAAGAGLLAGGRARGAAAAAAELVPRGTVAPGAEWIWAAATAAAALGALGLVTGIAIGRRRARGGLPRPAAAGAQRESESRLRLLMAGAPAGIAETDAVWRCVFANPRWCELTGMDLEDPGGAALDAVVHPDDVEHLRREWDEARRQGRPITRETRLRARDGREPWVVLSAAPLGHATGDDRGGVWIATDISEPRGRRARFALADRMASVGSLAAGVAHEINNPLAYLIASIDFAVEELRHKLGGDGAPAAPVADAFAALADARDGAERVRRIVRDLSSFSFPEGGHATSLDVERILESCIAMASNELRHRAVLVREISRVPRVVGSEARLAQVFLSLLLNAARSIREGEARSNEIRVAARTDPRGCVAVDIEDTGRGIDAEAAARLFDPSSAAGQHRDGAALGLWMCQSVVAAMGGEIHVESKPGKGSRVRVLLPAAPAVPAAPAAPDVTAAARVVRDGRVRVLVVDDEPLIGTAVRRMLEADHDVVAVTSARDALAALRAGAFDVILCDLMMPEMTGMDLYDELGRMSPGSEARMVFFTGGAFTARAQDFLDRVPNPKLEKPLQRGALQAAVRSMTRVAV